MAAPSDAGSVHDDMTRIRMKMVQRKLANERERLNRPESSSDESNGAGQYKLQQALLRRQQLLDKLKLEQLEGDQRARSASPRPRRRYTASTLPPPSRRSLPGDFLRNLSRSYNFNWYNQPRPVPAMVPNNYIIEHQYPSQPPVVTQREVLPQIVHVQAPPQPQQPQQIVLAQGPPPPPQQILVHQPVATPPPPQITTIQAPTPQVHYRTVYPSVQEPKETFRKSDFMDMMMLQNAQMHHMVMQQMMLSNLPGPIKLPTAEVPVAPIRTAPLMSIGPPPAPVVHHMQTLPPLEPRYPASTRVYNNAGTFYDDGSNYYTYH